MTETYQSATAIAQSIIAQIGPSIVLGLPIGIGKATHVADALFKLAAADSSLSLTIFTGLTLQAPTGRSELEKRFLEPLVERLYANWPVPHYAEAIRNGTLPANVHVQEFYLRPGAYLGDRYMQQNYSNINYSQVASELMRLGVNVVAQLVAKSPDRAERYSLGANPEVTLDLMPYFEERRSNGLPALLVGQVNRNMPYMLGDADIAETELDLVLDAEKYDFPLFSLPNRRVSDGDYATAMHVASLVRDGGTLQIGIGSLSDAVAHCLRLRHTAPDVFASVLARLPGGTATQRRGNAPVELAPFRDGLYSSTELMSDALFSLFEAGLIKRPADATNRTVLHAGFFIGSSNLYEALRTLPEEQRQLIDMTRISQVNTLFGGETKKRQQRHDARFINETMMLTLLGAAVSDALEDGRVVSGVGGQFDFISMAQSLEGAMSILMCRARRESRGKTSSNILWNYGHNTVPRHHRDVFVTEYGIAATRGCSDRDTIDRLLHIADAEFQDALIRSATDAGKLENSYEMASDATANRPESIASIFAKFRVDFPPYPLGSELSNDEQHLAEALTWLQANTVSVGDKIRTMTKAALGGAGTEQQSTLARMALDRPSGLRQHMMQRLLRYALTRTKQ